MDPLLLENFFKLRPKMLKKYEYRGICHDYVAEIAKNLKNTYSCPPGPMIFPGLQKVINEAVINRVKHIFNIPYPGEISLELLEKQLEHYPVISYADHHGLLNYKLLYNSNLLYAEIVKTLNLPFAVVLAAGNVPLDNMSYPRGFYFKNRRFNFFGAEESRSPMFLFSKKLSVDRKIGINSFIHGEARDTLTDEEKKFLTFLFFDGLEIEKATVNYNTFYDQISYLNYKLWPYYFDKSLRNEIPRLIYLPSNVVIIDILCREIMKKDSLVSLIIFEPEVRRIFLRNFSGIAGCWSENAGSQLFWGVSEKKKYKRFIRLSVDDTSNSLMGENFRLALERETLAEALKARKIAPTLFFDYLILTFLGGYLTLGGFNQLDYLPLMQKAHMKSLGEIGLHDLVEHFSSRITDALVCGMMPCEFDSGIDLIQYYNFHNSKFNGNLEHGLAQGDLEKILNMKPHDMIKSALEIMVENISTQGR